MPDFFLLVERSNNDLPPLLTVRQSKKVYLNEHDDMIDIAGTVIEDELIRYSNEMSNEGDEFDRMPFERDRNIDTDNETVPNSERNFGSYL